MGLSCHLFRGYRWRSIDLVCICLLSISSVASFNVAIDVYSTRFTKLKVFGRETFKKLHPGYYTKYESNFGNSPYKGIYYDLQIEKSDPVYENGNCAVAKTAYSPSRLEIKKVGRAGLNYFGFYHEEHYLKAPYFYYRLQFYHQKNLIFVLYPGGGTISIERAEIPIVTTTNGTLILTGEYTSGFHNVFLPKGKTFDEVHFYGEAKGLWTKNHTLGVYIGKQPYLKVSETTTSTIPETTTSTIPETTTSTIPEMTTLPETFASLKITIERLSHKNTTAKFKDFGMETFNALYPGYYTKYGSNFENSPYKGMYYDLHIEPVNIVGPNKYYAVAKTRSPYRLEIKQVGLAGLNYFGFLLGEPSFNNRLEFYHQKNLMAVLHPGAGPRRLRGPGIPPVVTKNGTVLLTPESYGFINVFFPKGKTFDEVRFYGGGDGFKTYNHCLGVHTEVSGEVVEEGYFPLSTTSTIPEMTTSTIPETSTSTIPFRLTLFQSLWQIIQPVIAIGTETNLTRRQQPVNPSIIHQ